MRRVGLFAAFLVLLGLTTATAASFDVQAEDITSFTTDVSISVPDPPTRLGSYFLRNEPTIVPGLLDDQPTGSDPVQTKEILPEGADVETQTKTAYLHSWQTPPAPVGGLALQGTAQLRIFQNGDSDRLTAGLFDCPSASTATGACDQIGGDIVSTVDGGGYVERLVDFGSVTRTILQDRVLRVQIINDVAAPKPDQKWSVQWGYKSNRPSRLDVTLASP